MTSSTPITGISLPTPFPVGDVNTWLITDDPLTLVDTGVHSSRSLEALRQGLHQAGYAVKDIRRIVLTHAHLDHAGAAARLSQEAGATVLMHPRARNLLCRPQDNMRHYRRLFTQCGIPEAILDGWQNSREGWKKLGRRDETLHAMQVLADGESIPFEHENFTVVYTPGHCPDHISLLTSDGKTMLSGDHLLPGITPNPLTYFDDENDGRRFRSLPDYMDSLNRVEQLAPATALPGHGDIINDVPVLIAGNRNHIKRRMEAFRALVQIGKYATVYELARAHFGDRHPMDAYLTVTEALGALDLLAQQGALNLDESSDLISFTLT